MQLRVTQQINRKLLTELYQARGELQQYKHYNAAVTQILLKENAKLSKAWIKEKRKKLKNNYKLKTARKEIVQLTYKLHDTEKEFEQVRSQRDFLSPEFPNNKVPLSSGKDML